MYVCRCRGGRVVEFSEVDVVGKLIGKEKVRSPNPPGWFGISTRGVRVYNRSTRLLCHFPNKVPTQVYLKPLKVDRQVNPVIALLHDRPTPPLTRNSMKTMYYDPETRVIVDLLAPGEFYPGWTISRINVPEFPINLRGRGLGSKILKEVLADADKLNFYLYLDILPSGPLDYDALERWYMRYGFRQSTRFPNALKRLPHTPYMPDQFLTLVRPVHFNHNFNPLHP